MADFLRVELTDRPPLVFKTRARLEEFLEQEIEFAALAIGNVGAALEQGIIDAQSYLNSARHALSSTPEGSALDASISSWLSAYGQGPFPRPPSAERALLEKLRSNANQMRAAMCVLFGNGSTNGFSQIPPQDWAIGSFAAAALSFGATPDAKPLFRQNLAAQKAQNDKAMAALSSDIAEIKASYAGQLEEKTREFGSLDAFARTRIRWVRLLNRRSRDRSKAEMAAVHRAYQEQMRLQEPVQYWKDKEVDHDRSATLWFKILCGASAAVIILPILCLVGWTHLMPPLSEAGAFGWLRPMGQSPGWSQILRDAKGLTLIALVSGLTVWALRFAARVYLSERHLATDARERQTIVMTYIALLKENAASEAERAIVLQTLFRSSADGIVKDDAGMDPSLVGLLGKILERKPG